MEYKRLTERFRNSLMQQDVELMATVRDGIFRLAELEDKIEKGTLIDTESYFIIQENQWAGKNRFLICKNRVQEDVYDFCETREEAEKRLKELQNG